MESCEVNSSRADISDVDNPPESSCHPVATVPRPVTRQVVPLDRQETDDRG